LVDPGFAGGFVVGAGRSEPDTAAASYRAIGDEVPSPAIRSAATLRDQPIQYSGAVTGPGSANPRGPKFFIAGNGSTDRLFATVHFRRIG